MRDTFDQLPAVVQFPRIARATSSWFEECTTETEEWLIDGLVPAKSYTGIFGRRGAAKSFFALDMACCGALGRPFMGRDTEPFGSVYCVGEKKSRFGKRVEAWRISRGISKVPVKFRWDVPNLLDDESVADFIAEIHAAKPEFTARGVPLRAIFLDTLSRSLKGANVSDADATGRALNAIGKIIDEAGVTVLPMAHVAKAEGSITQKGAGEWEDAADALIRLDRKDGESLRTVTLTKQSDEADGLEFGFELEVVEVGISAKDRPVTSCVVRVVDLPPPNARTATLPAGASIARDALVYLVDNSLTILPPAEIVHRTGMRVGEMVVRVNDLRDRAYEMGLSDDDDTPSNRRQKWHVAKTALIKAGVARIEGAYVIPLGALGGVRR